MQVYIRQCFIIRMCKILVQNLIIKDISNNEKKKMFTEFLYAH